MKESEATAGTKLFAVIIAAQLRVPFQTALAKLDEQAGADWDALMLEYQRVLVTSLPTLGERR